MCKTWRPLVRRRVRRVSILLRACNFARHTIAMKKTPSSRKLRCGWPCCSFLFFARFCLLVSFLFFSVLFFSFLFFPCFFFVSFFSFLVSFVRVFSFLCSLCSWFFLFFSPPFFSFLFCVPFSVPFFSVFFSFSFFVTFSFLFSFVVLLFSPPPFFFFFFSVFFFPFRFLLLFFFRVYCYHNCVCFCDVSSVCFSFFFFLMCFVFFCAFFCLRLFSSVPFAVPVRPFQPFLLFFFFFSFLFCGAGREGRAHSGSSASRRTNLSTSAWRGGITKRCTLPAATLDTRSACRSGTKTRVTRCRYPTTSTKRRESTAPYK